MTDQAGEVNEDQATGGGRPRLTWRAPGDHGEAPRGLADSPGEHGWDSGQGPRAATHSGAPLALQAKGGGAQSMAVLLEPTCPSHRRSN